MSVPKRIFLAGCTAIWPFALTACGSAQPLVVEPAPMVTQPVAVDEGPSAYWVGHSSEEIVMAYGQPDLLLDTRPIASTYTGHDGLVSYVYRSANDGLGCSEAFVVDRRTSMIVDYHCH